MSGFMLIRTVLTETSPRFQTTTNPLMNSVRRTFYTVFANVPEVPYLAGNQLW